jgi:hypothetical protein
LTYKNTIRSDEFEQGSDQNTAKITAGNAGKEHTSCDSDAKGGDKKSLRAPLISHRWIYSLSHHRKVEMQPK